jgi:hypothetical protein
MNTIPIAQDGLSSRNPSLLKIVMMGIAALHPSYALSDFPITSRSDPSQAAFKALAASSARFLRRAAR